MIENVDKISLLNIAPAPWIAYLPFVIGLFSVIVLFSAIVLIISWVRKRNAQPQLESVEEPE
ncbi:MAG: hypothetical protein ACTSXA_06670 [Candidatus Heimdallarchaeota archaeon]